jgi:hypothetical protein
MSRAIRSRRSSRRAWLTRIAASSHNGVGYKNSAPVYGSMNETGNSAYNCPRGPCATVILGTSTIDNADPWTLSTTPYFVSANVNEFNGIPLPRFCDWEQEIAGRRAFLPSILRLVDRPSWPSRLEPWPDRNPCDDNRLPANPGLKIPGNLRLGAIPVSKQRKLSTGNYLSLTNSG